MRLEAGDTIGSNDRVMASSGRQLEPVARSEVERITDVRQPEPDRAAIDDDDLVVWVVVRAVAVARPVRPGARIKPLAAQAFRAVGAPLSHRG